MKILRDKIIMITGGTGSFGSTAVQKFINSDAKEIRIFSRDEKKQEDMRLALKDKRAKFYIGDVRDYQSLDEAMTGVNFIFHAAALKQVPSCEFYPMEAFRTNTLGAENVMNAAIKNHVERVVLLSTDKAVYPINAMGVSKAMMEKLMIAKSIKKNDTLICATRYGNVMGSRGSVIPLFINLIKSGKPITITDPNMTRFLMSLEESVNLVLHAIQYAKPGDIFIHKAPASTIGDLTQALKELFSAKNLIKIVGTRYGEKLYESLLSREEKAIAEEIKNYYRVPNHNSGLNYEKFFTEGQKKISSIDDYTSHNVKRLNIKEIKKLLLTLDFVQKELNA
jgi:UDP-N-acetylglucosamine 4,6-dehydratase/5-epimerase